MGVTALVMAGGKGTRMTFCEEKPLIPVAGKPMIEHVLGALENAEKIDNIVVAVSKQTPKTTKLIEGFPIKILETPGEGYVSDLDYAVRRLKLGVVLTISADLPLVKGEIIDRIMERYVQCGKPALTVAVPIETRKKLGLGTEYVRKAGDGCLVPAGINVIDGRRIDEGEEEEEIYTLDETEVALNVNTPRDLKIAERLFAGRPKGRSSH